MLLGVLDQIHGGEGRPLRVSQYRIKGSFEGDVSGKLAEGGLYARCGRFEIDEVLIGVRVVRFDLYSASAHLRLRTNQRRKVKAPLYTQRQGKRQRREGSWNDTG